MLQKLILSFTFGLWAFGAMAYFWPVTLVLVLFFVRVIVWQKPPMVRRWQLRHLVLLLPLLLCFLSLLWGGLMADRPNPSAFDWPNDVLTQLGLAFFPCAQLVLKLSKGFRWLALSILLLEGWYLLWCTFMSEMAVSNVWL
jgi:hypothetical protein